MSNWADIRPALPPDVVRDIWREIAEGDEQPVTMPDILLAFVRIAIDHPHYANATEIADALGETRNRINPVVHRVKDEARKTRLTSGT